MADRRLNVVRVMTYLADDLQARQYPMAGVLRQLAREVATMQDSPDTQGGVCGAVSRSCSRAPDVREGSASSARHGKVTEKGSLFT
jgi:hypothetical protein